MGKAYMRLEKFIADWWLAMMSDENLAMISPTTEKIATSANTVPPIGRPNRTPSLILSILSGIRFSRCSAFNLSCLNKTSREMPNKTQ